MHLLGFLLALLLTAVHVGAQEAANRYPFAKGKIERLDLPTKQITLKTPHGLKVFQITDKTRLHAGVERLDLTKLKIGDPVAINYFTNQTGHAFINRLKIKHPDPDDLEDQTQ
jgi:Cu/Ag efflux protein CusF